MPTSTLTVTQADGSSETYTINRDKFEGIRTMNRKLDETIGDPENITGFTVSIGIASTNGTYTKSGLINGKPLFLLDSNNDFELRWTGTQWLWHDDNNGDVFYTSSEDTDYPWEVTTWVGGSQPTFSSFVGGTIGSTVTDTVSVDHTPTDDIRNLLVDAQNVTINRSLGGGIRTLFIDGVEVTIDRSDELIVQRFLDLFTGATAAYSLRRLGSYNGSALRIRRTSDNVEVNVAFNSAEAVGTDSPITNTTEQGGEIGSTTATTLGAFLTEGGNQDATVHTWYDQSGNGNDATQSSTGEQPKIAEAGIIKTQGGKPCLDFDGTNHKLDIDGYAPLSLVYSSFVVASLDDPTASSIKTIFDSTSHSNGGFAIVHGNTANKFTPFWFDGDDTSPNVFGSGSDLTSTEALYSTIIKTGASTVHIDGTLDQTLTNTWTLSGSNNFSKSTIGYDQSTLNREFNGKIQEIIIYESDQSANRTAIDSNIIDYYDII